jgi:putative endonuclease
MTMYVYLLQSINYPEKRYIGSTENLKQRISEHNSGKSKYTKKYMPWKLVAAIWFEDDKKARNLEKYLKIGSGHAFAKRHFW